MTLEMITKKRHNEIAKDISRLYVIVTTDVKDYGAFAVGFIDFIDNGNQRRLSYFYTGKGDDVRLRLTNEGNAFQIMQDIICEINPTGYCLRH